MPQHVWMDLKADFSFVACAREQLGKARRGERTTTSEAKTKGEAAWRFSSRMLV